MLGAAWLAALPSSGAFAVQSAGPSANSMSISALVLIYNNAYPENKLTDDQVSLLNRVRVHPDRMDPKHFYYVTPMSIPVATEGAPDWSESANSIAFQGIEDMDRLLRVTANRVAGLPVDDLTKSSAKDALLSSNRESDPSLVNKGLTEEDVREALRKATAGAADQAKAGFVEYLRAKLPETGRTAPAGINYESALLEYASVVKTLGVVNVSIPVGFGLDPATVTAMNKVRNGLIQQGYAVDELANGPTWKLDKKLILSDSAKGDRAAGDILRPSLNVNADIFSNYNDGQSMNISAAGGTLTLALNYAGAVAYGYGNLDKSKNPLLTSKGYGLHEFLPGFLSQELSHAMTFSGYAECRFKGSVDLSLPIALQKTGVGVAVPLPAGGVVDSTAVEPDLNECVIHDQTGAVLQTQDPEIGRIAEAFKKQHMDQQMRAYSAAYSLKNELRQKAQSTADGWKYLSMPKENRLVTDWSSSSSCHLERTTQYCAETETDSFLGIDYSTYCSRWDWNQRNVCNTYYKAMDRYVQVDAPVAYFKSLTEYRQAWDQTVRIDFSQTVPVKFTVSADPVVCIQRQAQSGDNGELSLERTRCNGKGTDKGERKTHNDFRPDPTKPGGGLESIGDHPATF